MLMVHGHKKACECTVSICICTLPSHTGYPFQFLCLWPTQLTIDIEAFQRVLASCSEYNYLDRLLFIIETILEVKTLLISYQLYLIQHTKSKTSKCIG